MNNKEIGYAGESLACAYLERKGYSIMERNYRTRAGEIDIIARKGGKLAFVEVKTRLTDSCGTGAEAVDDKKRMHIRKAATQYILGSNIYFDSVELQVIEINANHLTGLYF